MPELLTIDIETTSDKDVMIFHTNQTLTEEDEEVYRSADEGESGSSLAQILFFDIDGVARLTIKPDYLVIRRERGADWDTLMDDIRDVLKDFFA